MKYPLLLSSVFAFHLLNVPCMGMNAEEQDRLPSTVPLLPTEAASTSEDQETKRNILFSQDDKAIVFMPIQLYQAEDEPRVRNLLGFLRETSREVFPWEKPYSNEMVLMRTFTLPQEITQKDLDKDLWPIIQERKILEAMLAAITPIKSGKTFAAIQGLLEAMGHPPRQYFTRKEGRRILRAEARDTASLIGYVKATLSKELTEVRSTHEQALVAAKQENDDLFDELTTARAAREEALLAAQDKESAFQEQISSFQEEIDRLKKVEQEKIMLFKKLETEIIAQKLAEAKLAEQLSSFQEETERLRKKNDLFGEVFSQISTLTQTEGLLN